MLPPCQLTQYCVFSWKGISNSVNVFRASCADGALVSVTYRKHKIKILKSADLVIKFTAMSSGQALTAVLQALAL